MSDTVKGVLIGIGVPLILAILGWFGGVFSSGLDANDEDQIKRVIEETRVITEDEVDEIKDSVSSMEGELKTLNATNQAILSAILNE